MTILGQPFMVIHLGQPLLEMTKMAPIHFHTSLKCGPHLNAGYDSLVSKYKYVVLHQTSFSLFPLIFLCEIMWSLIGNITFMLAQMFVLDVQSPGFKISISNNRL